MPGVVGWAAGKIVFDSSNPTMNDLGAFDLYAGRLIAGAFRRRRAVFFAEKLVVSPDAISIQIVIFGLAQDKSDLREKDLAIDAVLILFGVTKLDSIDVGIFGSLLHQGVVGTIAMIVIGAAALLYQFRDVGTTITSIDRSAYSY
jgi:hypothetical protein